MILADSSVWIDHIRRPELALSRALNAGEIAVHPFVIGEIALGSLRDRQAVVAALDALPTVQVAQPEEVLAMVEALALFSLGIGYVDAHLIASTRLTPGMTLWTRDRRLNAAATRLGIAYG